MISSDNAAEAYIWDRSELDFYNRIKRGGRDVVAAMSPEEATYFAILEQKVAFGQSVDQLNKKDFQSAGTITNSHGGYQNFGSSINPVVVNTTQEIYRRNNNHSFSEVRGQAGLYKDSDNVFYFVKETKKRNPLVSSSNTFAPWGNTIIDKKPIPPTTDPTPKVHKDSFAKARTAKKPDDDLIFNSPDYKATYEEVIKEISLSIIESGDDIISHYNYESIDSLPDVDIEIKVVDGEYLNAKDVIDKGLGGEKLQSVLDNSESSEEIEIASKILTYLEERIGISSDNNEKSNYFGSFSPNELSFNVGVPRSGESNLVDFNINLPDEYSIPGVNEIIIRFDPI